MDVGDVAIDFDKLPHNKAKQSDIDNTERLYNIGEFIELECELKTKYFKTFHDFEVAQCIVSEQISKGLEVNTELENKLKKEFEYFKDSGQVM